MSSGILTDLPKEESFRPWHFFVLASILLATAAVVLARQGSASHLILLSVTIAAAGAAAGAFYRTLAPLVSSSASRTAEPLDERTRAALQREKMLVLRSIKELEFDRAMGKVSPKDFHEMSARLRARAVSLMKQLDAESRPYTQMIEKELEARLKPAARFDGCASCGTSNDVDAVFCKKCGTRLQA